MDTLRTLPRPDFHERTLGLRGRMRALAPLLRLLRYVWPHRRLAILGGSFGCAGFLLSFVYPWIIGSVVDLALGEHARGDTLGRLRRLTELAALTGVMHAVVLYGRGHFNVRLSDAIVADLRRQLYDHLQKLSIGFYTKQRTGALLARVLHDVQDATAILYVGLLVVALDAAQLLIAFVLLAGINAKLAVACTAVLPLYGLAFVLMNPRVRRASGRVRAQFSAISANLAERLGAQALVKTYAAEAREARLFSEQVSHHHELTVQQSHEGHLVVACGEALVHLGTTIVIGYGGWLALSGEISPGKLMQFLGYMVILYGPVRRFAELNMTYQSSLSAIRRVLCVLDVRPSVTEHPGARYTPPPRGHVRYEAVRFTYGNVTDEGRVLLEEPDAEGQAQPGMPPPWVLKGVTLEAAPGERVAIVGASGAGKSTLLSLLPRLYDVSDGRVLVDGVDVRDYALCALRSAIGIVQQESLVFTGTIAENIAYGRPQASSHEIAAAARAAHAHDFITALPDGYATRLGERGVNLSGGQRQRISIARAVLKDPRILILDEATSSLDAESESIVQAALEQLMKGRTCFIIAHRLSTIRTADRILVLDEGRLVEAGSHEQLLRQGGRYARFIRKQVVVG
jgi:ABC-type multidrug transport system fused ATPase/permease subunit